MVYRQKEKIADTRTGTRRTWVRPKKRFGQHFLVDRRVAEGVVQFADPSPEEWVLEVGPGRGALTEFLLARPCCVVGIEVDPNLCCTLRAQFGHRRNFRLLEGDILQIDLEVLLSQFESRNMVVVGNLPYNITSPLLFKLLDHHDVIGRALLMVQREVARRIVASPGSKDYGILSIAIQLKTNPKICFDVGPAAFRPVPKVNSCVIKLDFLKDNKVFLQDEALFHDLVKTVFGQRRKMLKNTLSLLGGGLRKDAIPEIRRLSGIDLKRRPETLDLEEFARLSDAVKTLGVL